MLKVYSCLSTQHDFRLVLVAAVICLLSCATALGLFARAAGASGQRRIAWLAVMATVTGAGVWATHFVAILAFRTGLPTGYEAGQTLASLILAISLFGLAFHVALSNYSRAPLIGGALAGLAIGAMHYLGMAAFRVEGRLSWDVGLIVASMVIGAGFGAVAFHQACRGQTLRHQVLAALLLTVAICGLHFTGMGAATIQPDPSISLPASAVNDSNLAVWVAVAALTLLLLSGGALIFSARSRRHERQRLGELANAAVEGLAICDEGRIVTANASLARMAGVPAEALIGRPFDSLFDDALQSDAPIEGGMRREARVRSAGGETVPVELIAQQLLAFDGRPRLAIALRDLRDRVAAEAEIRFLAHNDSLTRLPNRVSFGESLRHEIQQHRRKDDAFAVLCLDLDRFKQVNDVLGHGAGDAVLKTVAERVAAVLDPQDVFARLGGDEFAIIRLSGSRPAEVADLCGRILTAVAPEMVIDGQATGVGVSIGVALFPGDGDTAETLVRNADAALYQAKASGRDSYRFFEAALGAQMRERQLLEFDLRHALGRGEFRVVYQPQARLDDQAIFGFEALIRWSHPVRGEVSPVGFIPLAEETGLILPIGEWVMREACAEAASWPLPLQIAINLSAVQLRSGSLSRRVREILEETGLEPSRLELEITETALIEDFEQALETLHQIKALGVKVAMDDFGTGYSSLSNLRAFPFDKIKIDQSFVRNVHGNEQAATIVRAILGLCRGLNLSVLAEGVETVEELDFLGQELCTEGQGYLFGRPGPVSDFPAAFARPVVVRLQRKA